MGKLGPIFQPLSIRGKQHLALRQTFNCVLKYGSGKTGPSSLRFPQPRTNSLPRRGNYARKTRRKFAFMIASPQFPRILCLIAVLMNVRYKEGARRQTKLETIVLLVLN